MSTCKKCGGTDIHVSYHKSGHAYNCPRDEARSMADLTKPGPSCCTVPEHLHFLCRDCSYGWVEPTKDTENQASA